MTNREIACLAFIEAHEGQWSWYQLHRAFNRAKLDHDDLMEIIGRLENDGLIVVRRPAGSAVDIYWPTEKAKSILAERRAEVRAQNRRMIIESLQELSDREAQTRRWLSTGPPEVSSFTEAVERLFTDSGLGDLLDEGKTGFGERTETILKELDAQLKKVDTSEGPMAVIDDPAMSRVRDLALDALGSLQTKG